MNGRQYTVRNVPASVDHALRKLAEARGVSLNEILLKALEREAGVVAEPRIYRDLDHLIGSWVDDPAFDAAMAEVERVDPKDWE